MNLLSAIIIFVYYITSILGSHFPQVLKDCSNSLECTCPKGYALSKARICEPIFTKGCPRNSFCLGNSSVCSCNKKMPDLNDEECNRECRISCPGKNCVVCKQGECKCPTGYIMSNDQCQPICKDGCPNGYCFRPEICLCNNGYARSLNGTCSPIYIDGSVSHIRQVVIKKDIINNSSSHNRARGALNYLTHSLHQNAKLIILITCLILLAVILLLSLYGSLRNGAYYHLGSEEYKAREPFYVYY